MPNGDTRRSHSATFFSEPKKPGESCSHKGSKRLRAEEDNLTVPENQTSTTTLVAEETGTQGNTINPISSLTKKKKH